MAPQIPSKITATTFVLICTVPFAALYYICSLWSAALIARVAFFSRKVTNRWQAASLLGPWLRARHHLVKHQRLMRFNGSTRPAVSSTTVSISI